MPIRWKKSDLADPANDLCTRINGVYADVVRSFSGEWSCLWDSTRRFGPFPTRDAAVAWFDVAVADLRKGRTPTNAIA